MKRKLNKKQLLRDLERDEGIRLYAYDDSDGRAVTTKGFVTIGIGRLIDKRRGGGLSKEEVYYLLNNDVNKRIKLLDQRLPEWRRWPEPVQRATANMSFQLGVAGFMKFKRTIRLLRERKWEQAADNALKSLWARQTPNRARRVTNLIRSAKR